MYKYLSFQGTSTQTHAMWTDMADIMTLIHPLTMAIRTTPDQNTGTHGGTDTILTTLGVRDATR